MLRPRFSHSQCSDFDADKLSGVGINSSGGPILIVIIFTLVLKINFDRNFNDPRELVRVPIFGRLATPEHCRDVALGRGHDYNDYE